MISWLKFGLWTSHRKLGGPGPIGGLMPSLHVLYGIPLPDGWVSCDGQVLNDPASVLHGQTIPDLNGEAATVIGADSGFGTFVGANTNTIAVANLPTNAFPSNIAGGHPHTYDRPSTDTLHAQLLPLGAPMAAPIGLTPTPTSADGNHTHTTQLNAGPQTPLDNRQRSVQVRWIMRTK